MREKDEQNVPLSAAQPPDTQQDEAELQTASKDEGEEEEGTTSTSDDTVDETKIVKDDEEVEPDIDPAAQQTSQEFEISRQGSIVQPVQLSPTYLNPERVIQ